MTSARQIKANRANGALGGLKTPQGRSVSRFNAITHGLTAATLVLPAEDVAEFETLRASLKHDLAPTGSYEDQLAEQVVVTYWRVLRLRGIETALLTLARQYHPERSDPDQAIVKSMATPDLAGAFHNYLRYDTAVERSYYHALRQFEHVQAVRRKHAIAEAVEIGIGFVS